MGERKFYSHLIYHHYEYIHFFFCPEAGLQFKIKRQNSVNSLIFHIPGFTFILSKKLTFKTSHVPTSVVRWSLKIFFFSCFFYDQLKALEKTGRFNGSSFIFPLPLPFFGSHYFAAGEVSSHNYSVPFNASVVSLGLDLCCSLTLQHIPLSPALQAQSRCSLQGTTALPGCQDPPFPWEYTYLLLGSTWLSSPAFGWLWFFCFPPFAIPLGRSSLSRLLCCCSRTWCHCGVPLPIAVSAASSPSWPWVLKRKAHLFLSCLSCPDP